MNKTPQIFFLFFFIFLFFLILVSITTADWAQPGQDIRHSYVSDGFRTYSTTESDKVVSTQATDQGSSAEPLIYDWDGDGDNEVIIIRATEIKIYSGSDFVLEDSYSNATITVQGEMVIVDYDLDSKNELIFSTNTQGSTNAIFILEWNGTHFDLDKIYNDTEASNGFVCRDTFGSATIECIYISRSGNVTYFTESQSPTNLFSLSNNDCLDGSLPTLMDYDGDNDFDLFFLWDSTCNTLMQYKNTAGVFTQAENYSVGYAINEYALADLDGGTLELVFTSSRFCNSAGGGCNPGSTVYSYNPLTGSLHCSRTIVGNAAPYIMGLNTCYNDIGGLACDMDDSGANDIVTVQVNAKNDIDTTVYAEVVAYNSYCIPIYNQVTGSLRAPTGAGYYDANGVTALYSHAVTGNFDADSDPEILLWDSIIDFNGSFVSNHTIYPDRTEPFKDTGNYLVVGDIDGDGSDDIISQGSTSEIFVYSYGYTNAAPTRTTTWWAPINPVCVNTRVRFITRFSDLENDAVTMSVRCYGPGNSTNVTASKYLVHIDGDTDTDLSVYCNYNQSGFYRATIYIWDIAHKGELINGYEYGVVVANDDQECRSYGDGSYGDSDSGTVNNGQGDDSSEDTDDLSNFFGSLWLSWGLFSSTSKFIAGMIALIVVCIGVAGIFLSYHQTPSPMIISLVAVLMSILNVSVGLFSTWIILLVILISIAVTVTFVAGKTSPGGA